MTRKHCRWCGLVCDFAVQLRLGGGLDLVTERDCTVQIGHKCEVRTIEHARKRRMR